MMSWENIKYIIYIHLYTTFQCWSIELLLRLRWLLLIFCKTTGTYVASSDVSPMMSRAFVSHLSISCHFYWKENFVHTYSCMNLSTQGSNSGLPHCRQSLHCLSHQRSPCMFSVQPLSHVRLFVTPWIAARQTSLSSPTPRTYSNSTQLSHPLSSPSPPVFNLSQHQGLFQWVCSSYWWPKS